MAHPNKHIREAIKYAESKGWRFVKASAKAHIYGVIYCPEASREGHRVNLFSTPRKPESHARDIRRKVDNCNHGP